MEFYKISLEFFCLCFHDTKLTFEHEAFYGDDYVDWQLAMRISIIHELRTKHAWIMVDPHQINQ
jgi:3-deoxy-D-manno-octulosonate 8-phosphate phosphatase KdsC-like HAD superfamily phosphatase